MRKKKKKFSTRKIIPPCGQTDSSQIGTRAHFPAIWKILPLAGHTSPPPHHPKCSRSMQSLFANLQRFGPGVTAQRQATQPEMTAFQLGKKSRDFQKRCSYFCPWVPPSHHSSRLEAIWL